VRPSARWRTASSSLRRLPEFIIIGGQRCGTRSLYSWLSAHPRIDPAAARELHYFDSTTYARGEAWYRSQFPLRSPRRLSGESTPNMLFHPLAPRRAARDLPETTRFIVVLRDPVERALSHYWYTRARKIETEPPGRAMELEESRLRGEYARAEAGLDSPELRWFSYVSRGEYAGQLRRWFDVLPRERFVIVESERLFTEANTRTVTDGLGIGPNPAPFPAMNHAERTPDDETATVEASLRTHFAPRNEELFELLGFRLWDDLAVAADRSDGDP
jgi:hypothetical protein